MTYFISPCLPCLITQIHKDVEAVAVCHRDMTARLKATRTVTSELISQTAQFRNGTKQLEMKSKVCLMFKETGCRGHSNPWSSAHTYGLSMMKVTGMMLECPLTVGKEVVE